METMTADEPEANDPDAAPSAPRRACAATVVAALYVLLVLGSPLIVRYGPDPEVASAAAAAAIREATALRCASALEYGRACAAAEPKGTPGINSGL